MTVQIVEISGQKMAVLPVADYERLVDMVEDRLDAASAAAAERRRKDGEEYVPAQLIDRILAGENSLKAWREHRGLTQLRLSETSGIANAEISSLERGQRTGTARTWQALANALQVPIEDILPLRA